MTSGPLIVRAADVRACEFCMAGSRVWLAERGRSWDDFITNGIPIEWFDQLNDGLGNVVAAYVRRKAGA